MPQPNLGGRGAAILDAVVERFILTGEPVGSVAIAAGLREKVSSATVRNAMAELERLGYLEHPHTSAGRAPTPQGYRRYVEGLQSGGRIEGIDERHLLDRLDQEQAVDVSQLLHRACRLLAEMSHLVALVSSPPLADTVFQHIDFVALEGDRVLAIVVARSGQVTHRVVAPIEYMNQEQLDRAAEYLVSRFNGRTLRDVAARLQELAERTHERIDDYESHAIRLGASSMGPGMERPEVLVEGAASLLSGADLGSGLQAVMEAIEQRSELAALLGHPGDTGETRVLIGDGTMPAVLNGCAVVTASYRAGGQTLGSVAVLGPTRLPYARAIGLVDSMARVTSALFIKLGS